MSKIYIICQSTYRNPAPISLFEELKEYFEDPQQG